VSTQKLPVTGRGIGASLQTCNKSGVCNGRLPVFDNQQIHLSAFYHLIFFMADSPAFEPSGIPVFVNFRSLHRQQSIAE